MGYNISEVTGSAGTGGFDPDNWTFDVTLNGTGVTTVSGDFNEVAIFGGGTGEASGGYSAGPLSTTAFGTLSLNTTTGQFTFTIDRAAVFASGSNQVVSFTVTGTDTSGTDTDTVIINLLICVARGTLIDTDAGPVPVENLVAGNMVRTADGPPCPVRWIGSRRISGFELAGDPSLRPVRIAAHALGANQPSRDLLVSAQHRILISDWRAELLFGETEVLVPAKALINDSTIRVDHDMRSVEYFHVLFDAHEVMFTEGLPTESFHPGAYAMRELDGPARTELLRLFPELAETSRVPPTARMALRPWEGRLLQEYSDESQNTGLRLAS